MTAIWRPGPAAEDLTVLLSTLDGRAGCGLVEMVLGPGAPGPPLHVHPTHGEGFYVVSGLLTLQVGQVVHDGPPGTWAFAAPDVPHALANHGTDPVRVLCLFTPGGFERRFERMLAQQRVEAVPPELAETTEAERATRAVADPISAPARGSVPPWR